MQKEKSEQALDNPEDLRGPLQGDFPNPGIEHRSPTLQVDSLPGEPPEKPKNTGVGSLSLLQGIFANPGIEPGSPALQADSSPTELPVKPMISLICEI